MVLLLSVVWGGWSAGDEQAEEQQQALAAKVEQLIDDLGADQFARREHAQAALKQMGLVAFDALLEAQRDPDIEIAMRAGYLVRSMPIRWARETDPRLVKDLLSTYSTAHRADRLTRMKQLAEMPDSSGIEALCRLVRFETDHLLSKQAALLVLNHVAPSEKAGRSALAAKIRAAIELSDRTGAGWMLTYAQTLEAGEPTLPLWQQLVEAEFTRLARHPEETDRDIVRDLLRWQAELLRQLGREDEALAAIRRTLDLMDGDRGEIFDIVDWSLERKAWSVVDEIAERFPDHFNKETGLIYRLAEAQRKRGEESRAQQTAARALAMHPTILERHLETALTLMLRQMYDWSRNEYQFVIDSQSADNRYTLDARYSLADMLFDLGENKEAAEMAQSAAAAIEKNPQLLRQSRRTGETVRGTAAFYRAMHQGELGNHAEQVELLQQAIRLVPAQPDYLIAMYRVPEADAEFRESTLRRIAASEKRLQDTIRLAGHAMRNARTENRISNAELLAEACNEYAWLISNTTGDYQAALQYSQKSLELEPNSGAYLDTLGRCFYAVGDLKNAVKTQRRAVERAPYFQQIRRQLAFFEAELAKQETNQESGPADESN